jgi:hypothetical protein
MERTSFELFLDEIVKTLRREALLEPFATSQQFEQRVRELVHSINTNPKIDIDLHPHPQAFPDIAVGKCGIEVKFSSSDTWRSVANSVLETNRINNVKYVYLVFGKMGAIPDVKWGRYEECVMHVRTSHVPRFEIEIGAETSLFEKMGVPYDEFRRYEMHEKMEHIRQYARSRLKDGERLWWLEDTTHSEHTLPIQARLYTKLQPTEKVKLRAEAALLCPQIVDSGRSRNKYDDVVSFLGTYHGVLCHQVRDLFTAGSAAKVQTSTNGTKHIEIAIRLLEEEIISAALRMDDALFIEYWGKSVPPDQRVKEWLKIADSIAKDWKPSTVLFLDHQ